MSQSAEELELMSVLEKNNNTVKFIKALIMATDIDTNINKKIKNRFGDKVSLLAHAYEYNCINGVIALLELNADPNITVNNEKIYVTIKLVEFNKNLHDIIYDNENKVTTCTIMEQIKKGVYDLNPSKLMEIIVSCKYDNDTLIRLIQEKYNLPMNNDLYLYRACGAKMYTSVKTLLELGASKTAKYDGNHVLFAYCNERVKYPYESENMVKTIELFYGHLTIVDIYSCFLALNSPPYTDSIRESFKNYLNKQYEMNTRDLFDKLKQCTLESDYNKHENNETKCDALPIDFIKGIYIKIGPANIISLIFNGILLNLEIKFLPINKYFGCLNLLDKIQHDKQFYYCLKNYDKVIIDFIPHEYIDKFLSLLHSNVNKKYNF